MCQGFASAASAAGAATSASATRLATHFSFLIMPIDLPIRTRPFTTSYGQAAGRRWRTAGNRLAPPTQAWVAVHQEIQVGHGRAERPGDLPATSFMAEATPDLCLDSASRRRPSRRPGSDERRNKLLLSP